MGWQSWAPRRTPSIRYCSSSLIATGASDGGTGDGGAEDGGAEDGGTVDGSGLGLAGAGSVGTGDGLYGADGSGDADGAVALPQAAAMKTAASKAARRIRCMASWLQSGAAKGCGRSAQETRAAPPALRPNVDDPAGRRYEQS